MSEREVRDALSGDADPLASASVGTAVDDLITRCQKGVRAIAPPQANPSPQLAVSLSGGGFRATLAGLGVLRLLADIGRWYNIWHPTIPTMWQGNSVQRRPCRLMIVWSTT